MSHLTKTRAYLLLLVTLTTIGISYATQDPNVITYLNSLRTNDSGLPNVPNQKGSFGYILTEIFNTSGKIKQDYLDLTGLGGAGDSVFSVNSRTGAVSLTSADIGLSNVENTKLSTWTGSSNVTTLGTVTTGSWNATAIPLTKIAQGSATSGQFLSWTGDTWTPTSLPGTIGLTSFSAIAPLTYSNTTGVFNITKATTTSSGYLSSTDWNTFNSKAPINSPALTGTPTRTVAPLDGDSSAQLATTAWVKANTVSAAGGSSSPNCYYTNSALCMNGYVRAPGTYAPYSANHNICCTLDASNTCSALAPGAGCQGNTIYAFYLNGSHYMTTPGGCDDFITPFCSGNEDSLRKTWSNSSYLSTNTYSNVDGATNTATIVTNDSQAQAAKYCSDMVYGGYSDWFLPAIDQLKQIFNNRTSIGGLGSNYYWSSTETGAGYAYFKYFYDGSQDGYSKTNSIYVRCIRKI